MSGLGCPCEQRRGPGAAQGKLPSESQNSEASFTDLIKLSFMIEMKLEEPSGIFLAIRSYDFAFQCRGVSLILVGSCSTCLVG